MKHLLIASLFVLLSPLLLKLAKSNVGAIIVTILDISAMLLIAIW